MGHDELKQALVRESEERVRLLWQEAEAEVTLLRNDLAERNRAADAETNVRQGKALARLRAESRQETIEAERSVCLEAETVVADRMLGLAREMLPLLVADDRNVWLAALARELPEFAWEEVRVDPQDRAVAEGLFPKATVVDDETVIGGLIVRGAGNRVQVDNSLPKRLERLWPKLLPELMAWVRERSPRAETDADETVS